MTLVASDRQVRLSEIKQYMEFIDLWSRSPPWGYFRYCWIWRFKVLPSYVHDFSQPYLSSMLILYPGWLPCSSQIDSSKSTPPMFPLHSLSSPISEEEWTLLHQSGFLFASNRNTLPYLSRKDIYSKESRQIPESSWRRTALTKQAETKRGQELGATAKVRAGRVWLGHCWLWTLPPQDTAVAEHCCSCHRRVLPLPCWSYKLSHLRVTQ